MAITTAIQDLKNSFIQEELSKESINHISRLIASRDLTVLQLVENLQQDLLNEQASHRCKSVVAFALVLDHLIPELIGLNNKEVELVTEFFCSKLKDHHSIIPAALQGIHALSTAPKLPSGLALVIAQAIFQDVHCQSQLQSDRRKIYMILKNLLTYHLIELQALSQDFVFGLIQAADQERDPRNLLILFSIFPIVARYFKLEPFTEEFFEVFSCYFPIDFTPPPNDPHGVTKEQLCEGLRQCLASSPHFAEYCLPLLQEKLDSDLTVAKVEALRALETCCETFLAAQVEPWVESFWKSIRREVLININADEIEHASFDALSALSRCFTEHGNLKSIVFTNVLNDILSECQGHLCEPERRLMTPSSYILLAVCAGSPPACVLVVERVIPLMINQYLVKTQSGPRQFILNSLNKFVHAGLYGFTEETVPQSGVASLIPRLLDLYAEVLIVDDDVLNSLSIQGLNHLVELCLNSQASESINRTLLNLLVKPSTSDIVIKEISHFFCKSANKGWFTEQVLDQLLTTAISGKSKRAFSMLVTFPTLTYIRIQVNSRLMAELEQSDQEMQLEIVKVLTHFAPVDDLEMLQQLQLWSLKTLEVGNPFTFYQTICILLRNLASTLSPKNASQFINEHGDQYIEHLERLPSTILIMEATLGSLVSTPTILTLEKLIKTSEPLIVGNVNDEVRLSACRLVAALINKLPEGPELEVIVDSLRQIWRNPTAERYKTISLFIWIMKALLIRSYSKLDQLIKELVDSVNDSAYGFLVAEGFKTILSDTEECLNFNSNANIRLMYRQRFFQEVIPLLLKLHRESETCNKAACFAAIANQLAFVPEGVLVTHITSLIPLLIQCLAVEQPPELITSTINTFMSLMSENVSTIENYVSSLVPRLLTLARDGTTLNIRRLSLRCLAEIRKAPALLLLPLRSEVIHRLVPCLDDKKRLVRREAALARHKWIMLGQAGCQ